MRVVQGLRATENQPFSGEVEFRQWLLPSQRSGEEESKPFPHSTSESGC